MYEKWLSLRGCRRTSSDVLWARVQRDCGLEPVKVEEERSDEIEETFQDQSFP